MSGDTGKELHGEYITVPLKRIGNVIMSEGLKVQDEKLYTPKKEN